MVTTGWICTVSKDSASFEWKWPACYKGGDNDDEEEAMKDEDEPKGERRRISRKHCLLQNYAEAKRVTFRQDSNIFVVGFSSDIFGLYEAGV